MKTIWRVSTYLFRYPGLFGMTQLFAVGMTLMLIAIPYGIKVILDNLQRDEQLGQLLIGVAVIAALYFGRELFNCFHIRVNNTLEQRVLMDMRRDLHRKLLYLPTAFYDRRQSGEISSRVIEDVANVERALLDGTEQGLSSLLTIVGVSVMLFVLQPTLAFFVFLPVPLLLIFGIFYARISRRVWKEVRESAASLNSLLVEDIQGNRLIQTFGLQEQESRRFESRADTLRTTTLRAMFRWSVYNPSTTFITNLGVVSVIGIGGYFILTRPTDFGFPELIAFFFYATMLYEPIGTLHQLNHMLAAGKASGDRVFEILDHPLEVVDPVSPLVFPTGALEVALHNVTFQYDEREPVTAGLNLTLPAGKVTALVGHTGAGKSTIANLIMRTYDVTSGAVRINGVDVRELALADLHTRIGYVAQDPFLFEGTVESNLRLAREEATEAEIIAALEGASAWDFVQRLPLGMQTNIGEKGIRLSQGEKQRLTIARVLLKNPPLIILDEATASVDTITERQIQQALDNLMKDRTVLVIAHRLSTVRKADQIVVLERGRILETGNHEALLLENGAYANLWLHQVDLIQEDYNQA